MILCLMITTLSGPEEPLRLLIPYGLTHAISGLQGDQIELACQHFATPTVFVHAQFIVNANVLIISFLLPLALTVKLEVEISHSLASVNISFYTIATIAEL